MLWNHMIESLGRVWKKEIFACNHQNVRQFRSNQSFNVLSISIRFVAIFSIHTNTNDFSFPFDCRTRKKNENNIHNNFPTPQSKWWKCSYTALDVLMEIWMEMMKVGRHRVLGELNVNEISMEGKFFWMENLFLLVKQESSFV